MPDIWLDVDAALASVPVNKMPLIDDTDFKTIEAAVVFNQAGMALFWNFTTTAGTTTVTAVTPTTAGVYDWTDFTTSGMYGIEIPASGGASANNDTEGVGHFTGFATGILPWVGPTIGFRDADTNNLLIDDALSATRGLSGTALPAAVADAAGGLVISDAGGLDMDGVLSGNTPQTVDNNVLAAGATGFAAIDTVVDAILVDTGTTIPATLGTPAGADMSADIADLPTVAEFEVRTPTAAELAYMVDNANTGLPVVFTTSGGSTTAAVINTIDGSAGSATNDQYNGRLLVFTSGTLKGVVTDITDYVGSTTTATITAIPTAPLSSHNARLI